MSEWDGIDEALDVCISVGFGGNFHDVMTTCRRLDGIHAPQRLWGVTISLSLSAGLDECSVMRVIHVFYDACTLFQTECGQGKVWKELFGTMQGAETMYSIVSITRRTAHWHEQLRRSE